MDYKKCMNSKSNNLNQSALKITYHDQWLQFARKSEHYTNSHHLYSFNHFNILFNSLSIHRFYYHLQIFPNSFQCLAITISEWTIPVLQIVLPIALENSPISKFIYSKAFLLTVFPLTLVSSSVWVYLDSFSMHATIQPVSNELSSLIVY